tara:strand:- start:230 stop:640 length:411 start_codon:yes stop_codon:yes gene_type:complete
MLVSSAAAQAAGAPGSQGLVEFLLPLVLIFVVFYFLLIRPQQKKAKQHRAMVEAVRRGDRVVTAGGVRGKVMSVAEDGFASIEISPGVRVDVLKSTLADVESKPEPAPGGKEKGKSKENRKSEPDDLEDDVDSDGA